MPVSDSAIAAPPPQPRSSASVANAPAGLLIVHPRKDGERVGSSKSYRHTPIGWVSESDYDKHHEVAYNVIGPDDMDCVDDLAAVVTLAAEMDTYIVRGGLSPAAIKAMDAAPEDEPPTLNRRKNPRDSKDVPSLIEVERNWTMTDIDGWRVPDHLDLRDERDHAQIIETLIGDVMHAAYQDVRAFYQFSSGCGLKDPSICKVHLWHWHDRPHSNESLRAFCMAEMPGVDHAPYSAVQPHYCTPPTLNGGHDPMPARTGWHDGTLDEVSLPPITQQMISSMRAAQSGGFGSFGGWSGPLLRMGDGLGRLRFYGAIRGAIWRYALIVENGGARDDATLLNCIQRAVDLAPKRDTRSPSEIAFYKDPIWLKRQIEVAFRKLLWAKR